MRQVDLLIIGGGAAGMAAAVGAYDQGCRNILIIERNQSLGGILRQCIHNGFGIHHFGEDLTGVEFAHRYVEMLEERKIDYETSTFVLNVSHDLVATVTNPEKGVYDVQAKSIILAMGCRERTRNQVLIPGFRGAGIFTAGTAQMYMNLMGYVVGKRIVVRGTGDIGLIMARRLTLAGAKVLVCIGASDHPDGLARNVSQCLDDFGIPLLLQHTVTEIRGTDRVEQVVVSEVDEHRNVIPGTEVTYDCDTLILSSGLIPENELSKEAGVDISDVTEGAVVSDDFQTSIPGVFSCGNVLHVHDLVDFVAEEGLLAGKSAAQFISSGTPSLDSHTIPVSDGAGVKGVVPQIIREIHESRKIRIMFRPRKTVRNCYVCVDCDGETVQRSKKLIVTPGEMCEIKLDSGKIPEGTRSISVRVEG